MEYPTRIQKDYNEHREKVKLSRRKQDIQRLSFKKESMIKIQQPTTIYRVSDQDMERKNNDVGIVAERTTKEIPVIP